MECLKLLRTLSAVSTASSARVNSSIFPLFLLLFLAVSKWGFAQHDAFISNLGQWDDQVTYRYRLSNGDFWLEKTGWTLTVLDEEQMEEAMHVLHGEPGSTEVDGHIIKAHLIGSDATPEHAGAKEFSTYHNYFIGNDRSKWKGHVPLYHEVTYNEVYPHIDLNITSDHGHPKMTYIVRPGNSPYAIRILYEGQRALEVKDEALYIETSIGDIVERGLYAYQVVDGVEREVKCAFKVKGDMVTFDVGRYDETLPLFIDPTVIASTNSGCVSESFGHTATFNEASQIYSAGRGFGTGYPTTSGAFQADFAGPFSGNYYLQVDMCLSKYDQDGSDLIYATYLGGDAEDLPHSMIANDSDQVIVLGSSNSTDYPVSTLGFDTTHNGGKDIVLTCLSSDGSQLVGSTYIGGSANDGTNNVTSYYADDYRGEVVLDSLNNVYIASFSRSSNFPATSGAYQDTLAGGQDGVICKLSPALDTLRWATFLGDTLGDAAYALKVSDSMNVFVAGVTRSAGFPMAGDGAYDTYLGGTTDAFVAKLSADGSQLIASSFFGTSSNDRNYFVELDAFGGVYLYGTSTGSISATPGRYSGPGSGGYVYKTTTTLDTIEWVTSFGNLAPAAFLVDNCNRIYISGQGATSTVLNINNFDTLEPVNNLVQAGFYLMKLSPNAQSLEFGTFYGNTGSHVDGGTSRFDKRGVVYQATCSNGTFPTTSWAYSTTNQASNGGLYDNTVFKIDFESNVAVAQITPGDSACAPYEAVFENEGSEGTVHFWSFGDGTTSTDSMPVHTYDSAGVYNIFYVISDTGGCYGYDTAYLDLTIVEPIRPEIIPGDTHCVHTVTLTVDSSEFSAITWNTGDTTFQIEVPTSGTYSVQTTADIFCVHGDTYELDFTPAYYFELPDDTAICEPGFGLFGPPDATTYLWNTNDTTESTWVGTTGLYTLTASDGVCDWVDSVHVGVSYVRFSTDDTALCEPSLDLSVEHGAGTIQWSTGESTPTITVSETDTYWVTIQNGICSISDTIYVNFHPELVNLGNDTVICEPFTAFAIGDDLQSFIWSTGDTTSSVLVNQTMNLWVAASDGECLDRDTIKIKLEQLIFDSTAVYVCDQDSVNIAAPGKDSYDYWWSNGATTQETTVRETGRYGVRVSTEHCVHIDTVDVNFLTHPEFSLGDDRIMCAGETLSLPVDVPPGTFYWSTGDSGSIATVSDSGFLWAAVDQFGCVGYDTVHVSLRSLDPLEFAMMANVITPNGDGLNDELKLKIEEPALILDYHLIVYDRWGLKVFETEDLNEHWKGTLLNGKPAYEGTYFYIMNCETICSQRPEVEIKDNVTVLR